MFNSLKIKFVSCDLKEDREIDFTGLAFVFLVRPRRLTNTSNDDINTRT